MTNNIPEQLLKAAAQLSNQINGYMNCEKELKKRIDDARLELDLINKKASMIATTVTGTKISLVYQYESGDFVATK